jgi:autotransporter-associated beta strand protein
MMYWKHVHRGQTAGRFATRPGLRPGLRLRSQLRSRYAAIIAAAAMTLASVSARGATEEQFTGGALGVTTWNTAAAWSKSAVPATGTVADVYKSTTVTYNVTTVVGAADLAAVQVAGNTSTGTAVLSFSTGTNSYLETGQFWIGSTATGQNGYIPGLGAGEVLQAAGSVNIDAGGVIIVDPSSFYSLSGTGSIQAYNEKIQGAFSQTGGQNALAAGALLTNSGTYTLSGTGVLDADLVTNTGTFNQAGGAMNGTSGAISFTNNGSLLWSAGTLSGTITNNAGATVTSTGSTFSLNGTLINSGKTTFANDTGTISTAITGSGLLVFNGTSTTATLTGTNAFTGQTTVAAGTLYLASPVGTTGNNFGGALEGSVIVDTGATLQNNADSQIANTSSLTINGGTYNLNNHNQSVGSLTMNAGQVQEPSGLGLGVTSGQVTIGTGSATITGGLRTSGTYTFNIASTGTLNILGAVAGSIVSSGGYNVSAGGFNLSAAGLVLTGGGTLTLSGASPLSSIDVKKGTLQLSETGSLDGANVSTTVESGGTLSLTNQSLTIGDLIGSGGVSLGTGALTVFSTGSTFPGTIAGSGTLTKAGTGTLILSGADSSSGLTSVVGGTLNVASTGSISGSSIIIAPSATAVLTGAINTAPAITDNGSLVFGANPGSGILDRTVGFLTIGTNTGGGNGVATVALATNHSNRTLLIDNAVTLAGTTGAWTGQLDLTNNDMVVTGSVLPVVYNQVQQGFNAAAGGGNWKGNGITSSAAASDTTHLTALGVILNNDGAGNPIWGTGTALGLFDGYSPSTNAVLVKYTYYGDANLDGKIDGSDYSRIDNGFNLKLTGWYNGDFNYDGVVDGSDYTLIDNDFNLQSTSFASQVVDPTAAVSSQIAGVSVVPEPTTLVLISVGGLTLLRRRHRPADTYRSALKP